MSGKIKGLVAVILCVSMLALSFPAGVFADTDGISGKKGLDFSANTYIAGKLDDLFELLVYSDAPYFTVSGKESCGNTACTDCALSSVSANHPYLKDLGLTFSTVAYGSGAFARYAFALIFGTKLSAINLFGNTTAGLQTIGRVAASKLAISGDYDEMNADNLKKILSSATPGDLIQARSSSGANHTMIFLKAGESSVTVLHSIDYVHSSIAYNKVVISEISYAMMLGTWNQVISLMRAEQSVYEETLKKGTDLHLTHIYTDEGGDYCTFCEEKYTATVSSSYAGVYKAAVDAYDYKGWYRSTGKAGGSYPAGSYIEVIGSTVNSTGTVFYKLPGGTFVSSEDFVTDKANAPLITSTKHPTGNVEKGNSFDLNGTVYFSSGLSAMTGYLLSSGGEIVQSYAINVNSTSVNIRECDINAHLRFSKLELGSYTYLITAKGKNGRMSAFSSDFTVILPIVKPVPQTPSAPTAAEVGVTSVTLKEISGCEYRMSGGSWQKSTKFTGLSPATEYTFYARVAETDITAASAASGGTTVKTLKSTPQAPSAPTVSSVTSSSVTLSSHSGYEYKKGDGAWQTSPTFSGLSPATEYTFYQRVAETSTSNASASSSGAKITTSKQSANKPSAPEVTAIYSDMVVLAATEGYEYRCGNGTWQKSERFMGLSPATEYIFYQRKAATPSTKESDPSEGTHVVTAKRNAAAPPAPTVEKTTDTSVTLRAVSGYEYRRGNEDWQTSPVFTGLSPNTEYTFYCRIAETDDSLPSAASAGTKQRTLKTKPAAPEAPIAEKRTDTTVTLKAVSGCEYRMEGGVWQQSTEFTGLLPAKSYTFYQRYKETERAFASDTSKGQSITTDKSSGKTASAPVIQKKTATSVTFETVSGCEYRVDGSGWQSSPIFNDLTPNTPYRFYQRFAETSTTYAGAQSAYTEVRTPKITPAVPSAPVCRSYTDTTIRVKSVDGTEYSIDGKNWQDSDTFTGLVSHTQYSIYARTKETDTVYASEKSKALIVTTDYTSVPQPSKPVILSINELTVTLEDRKGMEYSADGGKTWQTSPVFVFDTYGGKNIVCRTAGTERCYPSPQSESATVSLVPVKLTSDKLEINEDALLIMGVKVGTGCEELLELIREEAFVVEVCDVKGNDLFVESAPVSTGTTLKLSCGKVYTVVIVGDADCDGEISIFDLVEIKNQILEGNVLSGAAFCAADVNRDGTVDIFDYSEVRNSILNGTEL